jgi:hypothetical protein
MPNEKNNLEDAIDDPAQAKGPDPKELSAPIVTEPMMTTLAVFGLNCGMGLPPARPVTSDKGLISHLSFQAHNIIMGS